MKTIATINGVVIEEGSGNVYEDLGLPDANNMLVKAGLAFQIQQVIEKRQLTQQRAAELVGMTQPKLSDILRGKFRGISQSKMIECLNRLGCDIDIMVKQTDKGSSGRTQVIAVIPKGM